MFFAKFFVDDDSTCVAEKISQEPVDNEDNSAYVQQSLTMRKSATRNFSFLNLLLLWLWRCYILTEPTAQPADDDRGVMVTGVEEKKTIPGEREREDIRGPMPVLQ